MDRELALKRLKAATVYDDEVNYNWETSHMLADRVLCELLDALGYADVVAAWRKVEKWYA